MDAKRMHQSTMTMRVIRRFASLRLAWLAMLGLVVTVIVAHFNAHIGYVWIALPLALMILNLLAALATNIRLQREPALIVFHLALVALCVLAGLDAATRFHGRVELVEGQNLQAAHVQVVERGVWHRLRLNEVELVQEAATVEFAPGLNRQQTRSVVSVVGEADTRRFELGETRSLILLGYRFATTSNKGHAMVLSWRDVNGSVTRGAVHFPSYPAQEWRQQKTWQTPAGEEVTFGLQPNIRPLADSGWVLRSRDLRAGVSLSVEGVQHPLSPGEWIALRDGALRFDELRLWMGYRIDYQPLIKWMLVVSLVAITALSCYFYKRLWRPVSDRSVTHERTDSDFVARI